MFVLPQVTVLDYMQKIAVSNFRKSWEDINEEAEQTDVYGLGARNSLQEAVEAVMDILGMQPWCVQSLQSSIATLYHWNFELTAAILGVGVSGATVAL